VVVIDMVEVVVMEVVDEDYLMVVEVEDSAMNVHARFGNYHRLGFDHQT